MKGTNGDARRHDQRSHLSEDEDCRSRVSEDEPHCRSRASVAVSSRAKREELFVYNWVYIRNIIYGHCVDSSGSYKLLRLRGYLPFCYFDGEADLPSGAVRAVYKRMATSSNISVKRPFYQVFFRSLQEMQCFASENRHRCYMDDIHQTTMFLSSNELYNVGWIETTSTPDDDRISRANEDEPLGQVCISHVQHEDCRSRVSEDVKHLPLRQDCRSRVSEDVPLRQDCKSCVSEDVPLRQDRRSRVSEDVPLRQARRSRASEVTDTIVNAQISGVKSLTDKAPYSTPKVMVFDIEVRSSDLGMPRAYRIADSIEMISVVVARVADLVPARAGAELLDAPAKTFLLHTREFLGVEGATEIMCCSECELIITFFKLIESEDPDVITGYNIFGFDFDYMVSRLKLMLVDIPHVGRGCTPGVDVIRVDWASNAYGSNKYDRIVIGGRLIVDMFLYFKRLKLDRYSLEFVSNKFLGDRKMDMPFTKMMEAFTSGDLESLRSVAEYCIKDSLLVMRLFYKVDMWIDLCEIAKITRCNIEDIYTRGEQMKVVAQCVKECMNRGIVLQPTRETEWYEYDGAYVLEPVKGVYKRCALLDFQSLYPSIIIAYNICPSTYTRDQNVSPVVTVENHRFRTDEVGLFPGMIKRLLEERKAVKKLMSTCDKASMNYTVLNRRQNALKVCANSVYGIMGFRNSKYFGNVACAESVTAVGRLFLKRVIGQIESRYSMKVVYGDTDSCMVVNTGPSDASSTEYIINIANKICNEITAELPRPMALVFESYYESVILLSKKRYIMLDEHDRLHYKGVISARRDYCKYAKDTYNDIVGIIARGEPSSIRTIQMVVEYIDSRVSDLMHNRYNISELVITKSVKELDSYKVNQPHVVMAKRLVAKGIDVPAGTRLEYVFVRDGKTQGDKMRTPEEVASECLEIDANFYIEKQMITQIDDVLDVLGIKGYIKNRHLQSV